MLRNTSLKSNFYKSTQIQIWEQQGLEVRILSPKPLKKGLTASAVSPFCFWVAFSDWIKGYVVGLKAYS